MGPSLARPAREGVTRATVPVRRKLIVRGERFVLDAGMTIMAFLAEQGLNRVLGPKAEPPSPNAESGKHSKLFHFSFGLHKRS